jgi:hypothetical protein
MQPVKRLLILAAVLSFAMNFAAMQPAAGNAADYVPQPGEDAEMCRLHDLKYVRKPDITRRPHRACVDCCRRKGVTADHKVVYNNYNESVWENLGICVCIRDDSWSPIEHILKRKASEVSDYWGRIGSGRETKNSSDAIRFLDRPDD